MTENTMRLCRLCMYEEKCSDDSNKVFNVFETELNGIYEKIRQCTRIDLAPEDIIPPNVCKNCVDCLEQFSEFFEKCHKTDTTLKTIFNIDPTTTQTSQNEATQGSINHLSNEGTIESTSTIPKKSNQYDINNGASCSKAKDNSLDDYNDESDSDSSSSLNETKDIDIDIDRKCVSNINLTNNDTTKYCPVEKNVEIYQMDENMRNAIGDNVYVCKICFETFNSFFECKDNQSDFSCPKCSKVISERKKVVRGDRKHKDLPKSYKCVACGSRQRTSKAIPQKQSKPDRTSLKGYICPVCGKRNFPTKRYSATKTYRCKYCTYTTKSVSILNAHTIRKHQTRTYKCEVCAKLFKSELNLTQHVKRMHHSKKYICVMCGKAFVEKKDLKRHIVKNHASESSYDCYICGREFFGVRELKEHMCTHREGCAKCPNCDKQFFYRKYLQRHMLRCVPGLRERSFKAISWNLKSKSTVSLPNSSVRC